MSHSKKRTFSQTDFKHCNNTTLDTKHPRKKRKKSLLDYFTIKSASPQPSVSTQKNQHKIIRSPSSSPDIVILDSIKKPQNHQSFHILPIKPISLIRSAPNSSNTNNETEAKQNEEQHVLQSHIGNTDNCTKYQIQHKLNKEHINDQAYIISHHQIQDEWYHFKVRQIKYPYNTIWLKHQDLDQHKMYHAYLEEHKLSVDDAQNKVFVIEKVIDHHYNEETECLEFLIKWQGYPDDTNTWEPHECLHGNRRYIEYCIVNHLECEAEQYSDLEDDTTNADEEEDYTDDMQVLNDQSDIEILTNHDDDIEIIPNNNKENTNIMKDIERQMDKMDVDDDADDVLSVMNNNNNKNKNIKKTMMVVEEQMAKPQRIQVLEPNDDTSDASNYKIKNKCYGCRRDWLLFSLEWYQRYPICDSCPKHCRLYYAKNFKEDWFCPLCVHNAQCILFKDVAIAIGSHHEDTRCMTMNVVNAICTEEPYQHDKKRLFLYIKPKGLLLYKTYTVQKVNDIATGCITVRTKKKKSIDIVLHDINSSDILWAFDANTQCKRYRDSEIHKIMELKDDNTVLMVNKINKKKGNTICVDREQVITTHAYFNTVARTKRKVLSLTLRTQIFKYSQILLKKQKENTLRKNKFGANTITIETAALNCRYFDGTEQKENDLEMNINTDGVQQLLQYFNINEIPPCNAPDRTLKMEDIAQYPLVLIIGESGSGKSTILRSLHAQNPSLIKLCEPSSLEWDNHKCIISQFNTSTANAMSKMSYIGLNNVRTWLKPFNILSQGEQYRAAFARLLQTAEDNPNYTIMMDEFTSVLDRTNARCMSAAISKYIHSNCGNIAHFILASANADIIRYLQPNLVISLGANNEMKWFENPHNNDIGVIKPDVKVILDLPDFKRSGMDEKAVKSHPSYKDINSISTFDADLVPLCDAICVGNKVRELQCKVVNDTHAKHTATVLDVEGFDGCTITQIPCLEKHHISTSFNIGIIHGPSGCGKTTSGERLFGRPKCVKWNADHRIIEHFDDIQDFKERFSAVELSLRLGFAYFKNLSEGEQHRANIARYLEFDNVIIDEFTSYLDRETAKKVAFGVSNYIYRHNKRNMVFLCCKSDIISSQFGVNPNWVFDVQNKRIKHYEAPINVNTNAKHHPNQDKLNALQRTHNFIDITSLRNCWTPIKIRLYLRMSHKSVFSPTFARFHYMDAHISTSCRAWTVWAHFMDDDVEDADIPNMNDIDDDELELAGFISVINHFGMKNIRGMGDKQMDYREHRTVILPSFQGLGFGSRVADAIGEYLAMHGYRLHSKTAHPRYGGYRDATTSLWVPTPGNHKLTAKIEWKSETQRTIFGNQLDTIGTKKKYYIHLYKLHDDMERTQRVNDKLKSRVIVKRTYNKIKI